MSEAKKREDWEHTSALMALVASILSSGQKYKPSDFNPYAPQKENVELNDLSILKQFGFKEVK